MSKKLISESILSDIADAISEKTSTTATIKPADMAEMIDNISSGNNVTYTQKLLAKANLSSQYGKYVFVYYGSSYLVVYFTDYEGYVNPNYSSTEYKITAVAYPFSHSIYSGINYKNKTIEETIDSLFKANWTQATNSKIDSSTTTLSKSNLYTNFSDDCKGRFE